MNGEELRDQLVAHTTRLRELGFEVSNPTVAPPASADEIASIESSIGVALPESMRQAFMRTSATVDWSWVAADDFPEPFRGVFGGRLHWSLDELVDLRRNYVEWIDECFSDADDFYDAVWHNKLAFATVPNGDQLAVDLDPVRSGVVVYLSHDDGEGHGYVLADSLDDLLDRWVPLACPGPEDWQWLPFVPWDEGPIDPACPNAGEWLRLLGLPHDSTTPTYAPPTRAHVESLLTLFHSSPTSNDGRRAGRRALKCLTPDRLSDVLELLRTGDAAMQETAADLLGKWQLADAVPALTETARHGALNGRLAAIRALRSIPGPEAQAALVTLRTDLGEKWVPPEG